MTFDYKEMGNGFFVSINYVIQKTISRQLPNELINVTDDVGDNVGDNVGEKRLIKILAILKTNNTISAHNISKLLNVTSRTIERDIEKLKQQKRLKRIGDERTGHWEVVQNV